MEEPSPAALAFRRFRIAVLLAVLAVVAYSEWASNRKIQGWVDPITLAIYPIPDSEAERPFAASLTPQDLEPVAAFLREQALAHGLGFEPEVRFVIGPPTAEPPPLPMEGMSTLDTILYSLELRWWSLWKLGRVEVPSHDIRVAILLHEARDGAVLDHSLGLMRGKVAIVHGFAAREHLGLLHVVLAHELLHVAGAIDLYDEAGHPSYPEGYADPRKPPTEAQTKAALMAGSIPLGPAGIRLPTGLHECIVTPTTASRIKWTR